MVGEKKVNLFIVGAAKCGTTFLYELLNRHRNCDFSKLKEPNYFSHSFLKGLNLYYKTEPVSDFRKYHELYDFENDYKYYGDASPSYLNHSQVPQLIYEYNPNAKIIIMLRNPIERAFSHYNMDKRLGYINRPFEEVVLKKYTGEYSEQYFHQYINLGFYSKAAKSYLDTFGGERVLFVNLFNNGGTELKRVFNFLELDEAPVGQINMNKSINFRSPILEQLFKTYWIRKCLKKITPKALYPILTIDYEEANHISNEVLFTLEEIFKKDQLELQEILSNVEKVG